MTHLILLIAFIYPIFNIFPRTTHISNQIKSPLILQVGYDVNGKIVPHSSLNSNGKNPFKEICDFWNNETDIYYDRISMPDAYYNVTEHDKDILTIYIWIVAELMSITIVCFIVCTTMLQKEKRLMTLLIILIFGTLYCSVATRMMATRTVTSLYNMAFNGAYDIQGSIYDRQNDENDLKIIGKFNNQEEFGNILSNKLNEYYHFTKCEKNPRMDIYQILDITFMVISFCATIIVWWLASYKYNNKRTYENIDSEEQIIVPTTNTI
jgi:hypothetical protein